VEFWVKNDGLTHPIYGGNKVRRAEGLIREAKRRGARRILTIGAVGSHHVLTMALFAKAAGVGCAAVLVPQPRSPHVVETIRAALGQGLEPYCTRWQIGVPFALMRALRRDDYFVAPGGSNLIGATAYADAVGELADQLSQQHIEPPDWIVVALGSGGTAAGLAAGVIRHRLPSRVLGVQVVPGFMVRYLARRLMRQTLRALNLADETGSSKDVLAIDTTELGEGYGLATPAGNEATTVAAEMGLELDPTYTAKAFAGALRLRNRKRLERSDRPARILYWHTLTATSIEPLLSGAPSEDELPSDVRRLLGST
jgi:D-cysteine desulfhydrase